jgi:signal transduction histidine kinase
VPGRRYTRWRFLREVSHDKSGLSLAIPLAFALVTFLIGLGGGNPDPGGLAPQVQDVTTGLLAIFAFTIARGLARFTPLKIDNMVVWAAAGAFTAVALIPIDAAFRGHPSSFLVNQLVVGVFAQALFIGAIGATYTGWLGTRRIRESLLAAEREISARQESLARDITEIRTRLTADVRAQLQLALGNVAQLPHLESTKGLKPADLSSQLMTLLDTAIRPLSHKLGTDDRTTELREQVSAPSTGVAAVERKSRADAAPPNLLASPTMYLIGCLIFSFAASGIFFGPSGLLVDLTAMLVGTAIHLGWVFRGRPRRNPKKSWFFGVVASGMAPSVLFLPFAFVDPANASQVATMIVGFTSLSFFQTAFLLITANRAKAIQSQRIANAQLQTMVNRLEQQEWFERERLARVVHGQVQSKVLVAALRLVSEDWKPRDLGEVRTDLETALSSLDAAFELPGQGIRQLLESLQDAWIGACQIDFLIAPDVEALIDQDEVARACLLEIAREAIANAAKHSRATECELSLKLIDEDTVVLEVHSPGSLAPGKPLVPGYGSKLFDKLSSGWAIGQRKDEVVLWARVEMRAEV